MNCKYDCVYLCEPVGTGSAQLVELALRCASSPVNVVSSLLLIYVLKVLSSESPFRGSLLGGVGTGLS